MLLVLGGYLGSGRRNLAKKFSMVRSFHYFPTHLKHPRYMHMSKSGAFKLRSLPLTDVEQYMDFYKRIVDDFKILSKMHKNVVVDSSFQLTTPREWFIEEGRKWFGEVLFVWVEAEEDKAVEVLRTMRKHGALPEFRSVLRSRRRAQSFSDPLPDDVLRVNGLDRTVVEKLCTIVDPFLARAKL